MTYSIGEFSALTDISIYTLRYYEKEGLIIPARSSNGRRCYSDSDITWIQFIKRLKETEMPIKAIQQYAQLRATGDSTLNARMEMLIDHRTTLKNKLTSLQDHLEKLDTKIDIYQVAITNHASHTNKKNPLKSRVL